MMQTTCLPWNLRSFCAVYHMPLNSVMASGQEHATYFRAGTLTKPEPEHKIDLTFLMFMHGAIF